MSMIEFIKQQRFVMKALRKIFSPKERLAIKEKTRYLIIDPDQDSDFETINEDVNAEESMKRQMTYEQKKAELSSGHFSEISLDDGQNEVEMVRSFSVEAPSRQQSPRGTVREPQIQMNYRQDIENAVRMEFAITNRQEQDDTSFLPRI